MNTEKSKMNPKMRWVFLALGILLLIFGFIDRHFLPGLHLEEASYLGWLFLFVYLVTVPSPASLSSQVRRTWMAIIAFMLIVGIGIFLLLK